LLDNALAPSSTKTYSSPIKTWKAFCQQDPTTRFEFAPDEQTLCDFLAFLSMPTSRCPLGVATKTMCSYMSSIKHHILSNGYPDPMTGKHILSLTKRGYKRMRGMGVKPKRPITISLLELMHGSLPKDSATARALWAILCVGVHGCFRSGELFPDKDNLRWTSVKRLSKTHAIIHLEKSKTDPYSVGVDKHVFATGGITCPIRALDSLSASQTFAKGNRSSPVFATSPTNVWTRRQFVAILKQLVANTATRYPHLNLQSSQYAGHSMRRGGATSMAMRDVEPWLIKAIGIWRSDCYMQYISTAPQLLAKIATAMASNSPDVRNRELRAAASIPEFATEMEWLHNED
jgi:hypothetical protein